MANLHRLTLGFVRRALLLALLMGTLLAQAQEPQTTPPKIDETMRNDQAKFLVRAEVNRMPTAITVRETTSRSVSRPRKTLTSTSSINRPTARCFQIFPNQTQPNNKVMARQAVEFPAKDDLFRWQISGPFGKEIIKVIASKQPIKNLSDPSLRESASIP